MPLAVYSELFDASCTSKRTGSLVTARPCGTTRLADDNHIGARLGEREVALIAHGRRRRIASSVRPSLTERLLLVTQVQLAARRSEIVPELRPRSGHAFRIATTANARRAYQSCSKAICVVEGCSTVT